MRALLFLQLPPTLSPNPQRRIVEQFKRALFAPQNSSFVNLKSEVKKVWFTDSTCTGLFVASPRSWRYFSRKAKFYDRREFKAAPPHSPRGFSFGIHGSADAKTLPCARTIPPATQASLQRVGFG